MSVKAIEVVPTHLYQIMTSRGHYFVRAESVVDVQKAVQEYRLHSVRFITDVIAVRPLSCVLRVEDAVQLIKMDEMEDESGIPA